MELLLLILTADLIKNPIGQDWKQQFEQLRQETSQIKQDIHAVSS
jgi:hypothetical protein